MVLAINLDSVGGAPANRRPKAVPVKYIRQQLGFGAVFSWFEPTLTAEYQAEVSCHEALRKDGGWGLHFPAGDERYNAERLAPFADEILLSRPGNMGGPITSSTWLGSGWSGHAPQPQEDISVEEVL